MLVDWPYTFPLMDHLSPSLVKWVNKREETESLPLTPSPTELSLNKTPTKSPFHFMIDYDLKIEY